MRPHQESACKSEALDEAGGPGFLPVKVCKDDDANEDQARVRREPMGRMPMLQRLNADDGAGSNVGSMADWVRGQSTEAA